MRTTDRARQDFITFVAIAALAAVALLVPSAANAAAGDLDPSFGDNGKLEPGRSGAAAVEVDSQGRYLVSNGGSIIAFDENGALDTSFGASGTALGGPFFAIDAQGRIVSGRTDGTIVRVDGNGALDSSFGDNGHIYAGGLGGLTVQPDGAVLVTSTSSSGRGLRIRRYTADGNPDSDFGVGGEVNLYPPDRRGGISVSGTDLLVLSDGDIVATGLIWYPAADHPAGLAVRLTAAGDPDPDFGGGDGMAPDINAGAPMDVEAFGTGGVLITGGTTGRYFRTLALLENGDPDTAFGGSGEGRASIFWGTDGNPFCSRTVAVDAELDSAGRIVLVGPVGHEACGPGLQDFHVFGVGRLLPDGSVDQGFGDAGKTSFEFSSRPAADPAGTVPWGAGSVAIDGLGRILFGGETENGMALARFEGGDGEEGGGGGDGSTASGGVEGTVAGRGVTVHRVVVPRSGARLARQGVRVLASCDQDCKIVVDVRVSNLVAIRMRLKSLRFAQGSASAEAGQWRWVVARLTPAAAEALRSYGGGGRLRVRVRAVF